MSILSVAAWAILAVTTALMLAACTTTSAGPNPRAAPARTAAVPAAQQTTSLPAPVPLAEARVSFAPLTGPPQPVADVLAEAVARQSAAHGLALAGFGDPAADYTIKGYLSAEADAAGTRAVYVWDVLDRDLKRLNRVSGAVTAPASAADPWAAVDAATLDELARQSVSALAAWLAAS
jgi:hypothetical protein